MHANTLTAVGATHPQVCLDEPSRGIVEFPEFDLPEYHTFFFGRHYWKTSAARMIENFMDISHFPWVHPGTPGDRAKPVIPNIDDGELYFEVQSDGRSRTDPSVVTTDKVTYRIILPFTIYNERITPAGDRLIFFFLASPISHNEIDRYMFLARNYALDESDEGFRTRADSRDHYYRPATTPWPQAAAIC